MNVDREDELRIQAPPGAASASESRLLLDRAGLTPEAQEREPRRRRLQKRSVKEKICTERDAICGLTRAKSRMRAGAKATRLPRAVACSLFEFLGRCMCLEFLRCESRGGSLDLGHYPGYGWGTGGVQVGYGWGTLEYFWKPNLTGSNRIYFGK